MKTVGKWLIVILVIMGGLCLKQWPNNKLRVVMCDVGQGDAFIISYKFNQILIDGGPNNGMVMNCLGQNLPFWDRQLELVVATHPESDHIGGLPEIIKRYKVKNILISDAAKPTVIFNALLKAMRESGVKIIIADKMMQLSLGEISLKVLNPTKDPVLLASWYQNAILLDQRVSNAGDGTKVNDRSVVLLISFRQLQALFTGDIEAKTEKLLLDEGLIGPVKVLKVAHHGSKTSSTPDWIVATRPETGLISEGIKNSYGFPHQIILDRFTAAGIKIRRTDQEGTVRLEFDGAK